MNDFEKGFIEKQNRELYNEFMADTKSHAAYIAAGIFIGIFMALAAAIL